MCRSFTEHVHVVCPECGKFDEGDWFMDFSIIYSNHYDENGEKVIRTNESEFATIHSIIHDCGFTYDTNVIAETDSLPTPKDYFYVRYLLYDDGVIVIMDCGDYYCRHPEELIRIMESKYPEHEIVFNDSLVQSVGELRKALSV